MDLELNKLNTLTMSFIVDMFVEEVLTTFMSVGTRTGAAVSVSGIQWEIPFESSELTLICKKVIIG